MLLAVTISPVGACESQVKDIPSVSGESPFEDMFSMSTKQIVVCQHQQRGWKHPNICFQLRSYNEHSERPGRKLGSSPREGME